MYSDNYILRYCFICKHHNPDKNSGMDIYCEKEKTFVHNFQAHKCMRLKWFSQIDEGK